MNEFHLTLIGMLETDHPPALQVKASFNGSEQVFAEWEIPESVFLQTKHFYELMASKSPATNAPNWNLIKKYGASLFDTLIRAGSDVERLWLACNSQTQASNTELCFLLECSPSEIANIPWEIAFDVANEAFVSLKCHFLRYISRNLNHRALNKPLESILVAISNPHRDLNVGEEINLCEKYWKEIFSQSAILSDPTQRDLLFHIHQNHPSFFHYAGHSGLGKTADGVESFLVLPFGNLRSKELAEQLRVSDIHTAFLNSCWSGQFQGFSFIESFATKGIPNILAMNQPANDNAAIRFAHSFYRSLSQGRMFAQALTDARRFVISELRQPSLNWGLPTAIFATPDLHLKHN